MIAFIKAMVILSLGAMMGFWLACLMLNSSEKSRKEEILFKKEMSSDGKYKEH